MTEVSRTATPAPRPKILLAASSSDGAGWLSRWLSERDWAQTSVAHSSSRALRLADDTQPEVAIIDLMFEGSAGVALAFELQRRVPYIEVVLFVEHPGLPEAHAARALGIRRLVAAADLPRWLQEALGPLTEIARARRRLSSARQALDQPQEEPLSPPSIEVPLPIAERRYREAYLRACMARGHGRREAAKLAGIPYTSLCVMLRKLGISQPD